MKNTILIIGAGINGLVCAYYLVQRGNVEIKILDQGKIPNPESASCGKHRLIHPWSNINSIHDAERALLALKLWRDLLCEISSDGFEQTGVLAVGDCKGEYRSVPDLDAQVISSAEQAQLFPFFDGINDGYMYLFPQFGVLFAEKILNDLTLYLRRNGVHFLESNSVASIDAHRGQIQLEHGQIISGDKIIVAAGYGTDDIVQSSFEAQYSLLPRFRPMRCCVTYVTHPIINDMEMAMPAWASLGVGDMWGIPPLRGIPMKLGCGDFTMPSDRRSKGSPPSIAKNITERYSKLFPLFEGLEIETVGINHWARINSDAEYIQIDKAVIVTSDNGSGFKFAPLVSSNIVNGFC